MGPFSIQKIEAAGDVGLHTIPELLLVVQLIGYFEFHRALSASSAGAHRGRGLAGWVLRVVVTVDGADTRRGWGGRGRVVTRKDDFDDVLIFSLIQNYSMFIVIQVTLRHTQRRSHGRIPSASPIEYLKGIIHKVMTIRPLAAVQLRSQNLPPLHGRPCTATNVTCHSQLGLGLLLGSFEGMCLGVPVLGSA